MTVEERLFNLECLVAHENRRGASDSLSGKKIAVIHTEKHSIQIHTNELVALSPLYPDEADKDLGKKKQAKGIEVIPEGASTAILFARQGKEFTIYIAEDILSFSRLAKKHPDIAKKSATTELEKLVLVALEIEKAAGVVIIQDPDEILKHAAKATWREAKVLAWRAGKVGKQTLNLACKGAKATLEAARYVAQQRHHTP